MKLVFISNYLSPHQKPFCDAAWKATGGQFCFVATTAMTAWRTLSGFKELKAPYLVDISSSANKEVQSIIDGADAVITDAENLDLTRKRYEAGRLTFRCSERLFKSRLRYLKAPIHWLKAWKTRRMYFLCSSAYTAQDVNLLGFFKNRCYKWGYFPEMKTYKSLDVLMQQKEEKIEAPLGVSILWVARPIGWKHPELAIKLAEYLKQHDCDFHLKMIGSGSLDEKCRALIRSKKLDGCVKMTGALPMNEARSAMERSEIFIFTSDRNEGWGAVMNESMNSACAVVANNAIGSVPYLVEDGISGLTYSSEQRFYENVKWLIEHPVERQKMGRAAYKTITEIWNAEIAARNLLQLIDDLQHGRDTSIKCGPCSKA